MKSLQINFRLNNELAERIDQRRMDLAKELKRIPSRSELLRMALDQFLNSEPNQNITANGKLKP